VSTFNEVWRKLENKEYRSAFVAAQFKRLVPFQIRSLRKQRGWSQEKLAENSNLTQGVISRAEDSDYGNLTVNTILKIAGGFDVAFVGWFVTFSQLDEWFIGVSEDAVKVPSFEEESSLFKMSGLDRVRRNRGHRRRTTIKAKSRAVFIDTRKEYVPLNPNVGERQLRLPLVPPHESHSAVPEMANSNPRDRINTALTNLIPKVQMGTMSNIQMGA
jgi:transcriptional regulator with XRE-family HTH domain